MATKAATRKKTFEDGAKLFGHIDNVDKLYDAVMADITERSFASAGWTVRTNKFDTSKILAPKNGDDDRPIWIISTFDRAGVAHIAAATAANQNASTTHAAADLEEKQIGDFHRAWAGDEMAYIDRVASDLFMSLNKKE